MKTRLVTGGRRKTSRDGACDGFLAVQRALCVSSVRRKAAKLLLVRTYGWSEGKCSDVPARNAFLFSWAKRNQQRTPRYPNAVTPTRSLAAQQCAQVRTELALALGRLSTRSLLVSNTRSAARRASTCNRTLLLRLVDLELRRWREGATTAEASSNQQASVPS